MFRPSALLIAGAAILATTGVAQAQQRQPATAAAQDSQGAVPWYERFTTSNGVTESITGDAENDRTLAPAWTLTQRWNVTVDLQEAQRSDRLPDGGRGDQATVGAYYQFTPNVRVGGQVSVETTERPSPIAPRTEEEEPRAGVRVESAFRF